MKGINRTIKKYICVAECVAYVNGKLVTKELPILESYKKLTNKAIEKHFKKLVNDQNITVIIKSLKEEEKFYSMSIENFLKNAVVEEV